MNPETLRKAILRGPQDAHWGQTLLAHANAWEAQVAEDKSVIDILKGAMVEVDEINGDLRKRLESAERLLMEYHDGDWDTVDRLLAALAGEEPEQHPKGCACPACED